MRNKSEAQPETAAAQRITAGHPPSAEREIADLRFDLMRNAMYHDIAEHEHRRFARMFAFVTILLGTVIFADLAESYTWAPKTLGVIIAAIGALTIVYDFGGVAERHASLRKRSYDLLSDLSDGGNPQAIRTNLTKMFADEPPNNDRINRKSYNRASEALYGDSFEKI